MEENIWYMLSRYIGATNFVTHVQLETDGCVLGVYAVSADALLLNTWAPLLLTWFNFNPSMDK